MSTITKPMALDESFNTTETTPRNQADVLAAIETAIRQGFGQVASAVEYDNTDSGLTADNVQEAIDEVDDTVDGLVDDVTEISSDIDSTKTATGNPLTLTDCAPINAESLIVELLPKQDLHGQQYPYVGGAGKNKLPMTIDGIKAANTDGTWTGNAYAINGVTFTINTDTDGNATSLKVNGTASATIFFKLCDFPVCLTDGTSYKINGNASGYGSSTAYMQVQTSNGGGVANVGSEYTLAYTSGGTAQRLIIRIDTSGNPSNLVFYPMIRLSTESDSTFAPYSNICPITGYTECEVDDVGANVWDEEWELGIWNTSGEKSADSHAIRCKNPIEVKPNTSIYIKTPVAYNIIVRQLDKNMSVISSKSVSNEVLSTNAECRYLVWCTFNSDNVTVYDNNISFNYPSTFTEYEPYQSTSATIQFGQTVYGAEVDFSGGTDDKWERLDDFSDVDFHANQGGTNAYEIYIEPAKKIGVDNLLANEMPVITVFTDVAEFSCRGFVNDTAIAIKFPKSIVNSPELAKQWCIDNNLQIAYEKATYDTISTPRTPLKMLKGTNNLSTNGTTIQLGYQPDNVIGEVKEKADKINFSEIVKYTISGNTADLIPLVIDGTAHNDIPIVTDITKYRMLCVELVLTPRTEITGVYFSAIAFTDGIYLPSGISVPVYRPSGLFHADVTINPDGNGGFKLSYIAINQSQSTPPDYYSIRVRAFNQF